MGAEGDEAEEIKACVGETESLTIKYSDNLDAPYKYSVEIAFDDEQVP